MRQLPEVGEHEWFVSTDILPGWHVSWRWGPLANGALAIAELRLKPEVDPATKKAAARLEGKALLRAAFPPPPGNGITARLLRRLAFGTAAHRWSRRAVEAGVLNPPPQKPRRPTGRHQRGRPSIHTDKWYRELATDYRTTNPKALLAKKYKMEPSAMRSAIKRCRDKGYIPATRKGVAQFTDEVLVDS